MHDVDDGVSRLVRVASAMDRWTAKYALAGPEVIRRAKRLAGAIVLSLVGFASATIISVATGQELIAIPLLLAIIGLLLCGVALRAGASIDVIANANIAINASVIFGMLLATGGASVGFLIATPVVPALAALTGDRRSILFWSAIAIATITAVLALTWLDFSFPIQPDLKQVMIAKFLTTIVIVGVIFGVTQLFLDDQNRAEQSIRESEQLLQQAARTAKLGHWRVDIASGQYLSVSEEYARIFGYSVGRTTTPNTGCCCRAGVFAICGNSARSNSTIMAM